jgi:hypothetical protein
MFGAIVADAAATAARPVQILERRGAGRDHPELLGVPETAYLKCWIARVLPTPAPGAASSRASSSSRSTRSRRRPGRR